MPPPRTKDIPPRAHRAIKRDLDWGAIVVLVFTATLEGSMLIMLFGAYIQERTGGS